MSPEPVGRHLLSGLRERDADAAELMDDPDCDLAALERTYADFRWVNAAVAGWRRTYLRQVRPRLESGRVNTLLDLGSGGGDVVRALARWARRDGLDLRITAADPDGRAHAWATRRGGVAGAAGRGSALARRAAGGPEPEGSGAVEFLRAGSADLVAQGRVFDVVVSNHVLHHLAAGELGAFLADSAALAAGGVVHSDIRRSPWAYRLYAAGTLPLLARPGDRASFVRVDGLISVRRSYTAAELRDAVPDGWRVVGQAPWRNLLVRG